MTDTAITSLIPIEYANIRVITTEQLAKVYECTINQIKNNMRNNRNRFVEQVHYYKLEGDALNNLRVKNFDLQISPKTRTLYLWTKRGASRHCKMLGTDKAWEMFDILESNYFDKPKLHYASPDEMFAIQANVNKYFRERIDKLEENQGSLERSVQLNFDTCKEAVTVVSNYVQNLSNNFNLVAKTVQELSSRLDNTPDEYLPINKAAANSLNKSVKRLAYMYNEQVGTSLPSAVYNIQEGIRILLTGRYKIDIDEELDKLQAWLRFDYNRRIKSKTKTQDILTPSEINRLSIYAPISTRHAWTHAVQAHVDFKIQHFQDLIRLRQE